MLFLWVAFDIWLIAALMLPIYILLKAVLRSKRRAATRTRHDRLLRVARGY